MLSIHEKDQTKETEETKEGREGKKLDQKNGSEFSNRNYQIIILF